MVKLGNISRTTIDSGRKRGAVASQLGEPYPGEVDTRSPLVRRVVAHPKQTVVQDQACVTGVAAGGEREELGEFAGLRVEPAEGGAHLPVVEPHGRDESTIGQT